MTEEEARRRAARIASFKSNRDSTFYVVQAPDNETYYTWCENIAAFLREGWKQIGEPITFASLHSVTSSASAEGSS